MCFALYAGTSSPMPQKQWNSGAPDLSVQGLTERDSPIAVHFSKPSVQYIGSTSGCGCHFPHVIYQNGGWPWFDDDDHDLERDARDRYNRQALVKLLQTTGEETIELYGVWDGNFDFATSPAVREEIPLTEFLDPAFRFKEQGFYVARLA